jgi:hypothetical protein
MLPVKSKNIRLTAKKLTGLSCCARRSGGGDGTTLSWLFIEVDFLYFFLLPSLFVIAYSPRIGSPAKWRDRRSGGGDGTTLSWLRASLGFFLLSPSPKLAWLGDKRKKPCHKSDRAMKVLRSVADSNRCSSFCRAVPSHSANRPYFRTANIADSLLIG